MCVISGKPKEVTEECESHKLVQQCLHFAMSEIAKIEKEKEKSALQSSRYVCDKVQVSGLCRPSGFLTRLVYSQSQSLERNS